MRHATGGGCGTLASLACRVWVVGEAGLGDGGGSEVCATRCAGLGTGSHDGSRLWLNNADFAKIEHKQKFFIVSSLRD